MADKGDAAPRIRYAQAAGGVAIAYWRIGAGPPLVHMPMFPLGHLLAEWRQRAVRAYFEGLARDRTVVHYDGRGTGLSTRDVDDYSVEAQMGDLRAVADSLALERFALLGFGHGGAAALAYAAQHPERVSHLVLWHGYARAADVVSLSRISAVRSLILQDWGTYTELEGYRVSGRAGGETARAYTEFIRESVTPQGVAAAYEAIGKIDVEECLGRIVAPTLIIARRASDVLPVAVAETMAKAIRNARVALLEGSGANPFLDVREPFVEAVLDFLASEAGSRPDRLSGREIEVLRLVAAGRSNTEIGEDLSLSVRTVARHITNIYGKIGVQNRSEATAYAIRHALE
jgi:pimeloyl-ACP methyl ester carboxylesterase/DNA-binding CsgD family transcriptional regulator